MPRKVDQIGDNKQIKHMEPEQQALRHGDLQPPVKCSHMNVLNLDQSDLQILRWGRELNWQLDLAREMLEKDGEGVK